MPQILSGKLNLYWTQNILVTHLKGLSSTQPNPAWLSETVTNLRVKQTLISIRNTNQDNSYTCFID